MRISELTYLPYLSISSQATVMQALRVCAENPDKSILITAENRYGLLSLETISHSMDSGELKDMSLEMCGFQEVTPLQPDTLLNDARVRFLEAKVMSLPVVADHACLGFVSWYQVFNDDSDGVSGDNEHMKLLQRVMHDIRSPLNVIDFAVASFKKRTEEEQDVLIERVRHNVRKIALLAESVLDLSVSGDARPPVEISLRDYLTNIMREMKWIGEGSKQIPIYLAASVDCIVRIEPLLLSRAVQNLVDNAVKHSPKHGTIVLYSEFVEQDSSTVRIVVADEGKGIASEVKDQMFEGGHLSEVAGKKGYGIGLQFVKDISQTFKGDVAILSDDHGASFAIELPVVRVIESDHKVKKAGVKTALLVDDDEDLLEILRRELKKLGIEAFVAFDGHEAKSMLQNQSFDIVVSDVRMPVCNGFELHEEMIRLHPNTPLLYMTGYIETISKNEAMMLEGAPSYLEKPFKIEDLYQKMKETVS